MRPPAAASLPTPAGAFNAPPTVADQPSPLDASAYNTNATASASQISEPVRSKQQRRDEVADEDGHANAGEGAEKAPIPVAPVALAAKKVAKRQKVNDGYDVVEAQNAIKTIFERPGLLDGSAWDPKTAEQSASLALDGFGVLDEEDDADARGSDAGGLLKQTVAILLEVPVGAKQWAVNMCPADTLDNHNILMHLNVRYAWGKESKKALVLNDREGTWGKAWNIPLDGIPPVQSLNHGTIELVIQVRREGFVIFANGKFVAFFLHRRELPTDGRLVLSLPLLDDMAQRQQGAVKKVWWGKLSQSLFPVPKEALSTDKMVMQRDIVRDLLTRPRRLRTLVVTGLPTHTSPQELQFIEEGLKGVLGIKDIQPEAINVVPGKGLAYVRLAADAQQAVALKSLQRYKIEDTEGKKFTLKLDAFVA